MTNKGELLYEGKAKKLFSWPEDNELVLQEFKNSFTAFNGLKKAEINGKGSLNRDITSLIFRELHKNKIPSHWVKNLGTNQMLTQKVKIIPLEVVVRNVVAGSLAKKFGIEEGLSLEKPIVDFHYKDDALGDPFVNDDQIEKVLKVANSAEIQELKEKALSVNSVLRVLFEKAGLQLIDFKLEFGRNKTGQILLADEISPDTCRLWDVKTGEKRDKDRFRRDMGDVIENYTKVWNELKNHYGEV